MGDDDMPVPATSGDDDLPVVADLRPVITVVRCSEDRTVFAEADNDEGWLATDYTVEVTR